MNFLQERFLQEEPLDKSNTPPAPMMTKTQQKIVTLICGLERQMPEIFYFVTAGIDYTLLRLGHPQDVCIFYYVLERHLYKCTFHFLFIHSLI